MADRPPNNDRKCPGTFPCTSSHAGEQLERLLGEADRDIAADRVSNMKAGLADMRRALAL